MVAPLVSGQFAILSCGRRKQGAEPLAFLEFACLDASRLPGYQSRFSPLAA